MDHRGQAQNRQVDHDPSTPFQRLSRAALDLVVPEAGIEREKRINAHKLKSAFLGMGNLGGRNRRARAGHDSDPVNGQQRRKSLHLWQETLPPPVRNQGIFNTLRTATNGLVARPSHISSPVRSSVSSSTLNQRILVRIPWRGNLPHPTQLLPRLLRFRLSTPCACSYISPSQLIISAAPTAYLKAFLERVS